MEEPLGTKVTSGLPELMVSENLVQVLGVSCRLGLRVLSKL